MKQTIFIVAFFFALSSLTTLNAQNNQIPLIESIVLRPLDDLLNDAVQYSPILKIHNLNVDLLYSDLKLLKNEWAKYIVLSGSFQFGNVRFVDNLQAITGEINPITLTRQNIFGVAGLTLRFPLSDLLTKQERVGQIKMEIDQQKFTLQSKEIEIRQLIIRQYNDIQRSLMHVEIKTQNLNSLLVTTEMAERYFREGNMELDDYTNAFNKKNDAIIDLEEAKLDAQLSLLLLKELVGKEITQ